MSEPLNRLADDLVVFATRNVNLQRENAWLRADLARAIDSLSETASLLYEVWRCNTDEERRLLGPRVGAAVEAYAKHPSNIVLADLRGAEQ